MKPQAELKITYVDTNELVEYPMNAKLHPHEQIDQIAASIEEFNFNSPILAWHNDHGEPEIVAGHGRLMAARKLGMEKLPVVFLDHMSDEQRRAYILVDNKLTMNSDFDFEILADELGALDSFDMTEFGFSLDIDTDFEIDSGLSENYSQNLGEVHYEPKETNHRIGDLYRLNRPDLDEKIGLVKNKELKAMLETRKQWFAEFNFAKIADYYAYQATKEEQEALEALGMVLLDKDNLIKNGFADLVGDL